MTETIPTTMAGVYLQGHGGFEMLDYRTDIPTPEAGPGQVLIKIVAAGVNNTDINTRIGWYSKAVTGDTNAGGSGGFETVNDDDAGWSGALHFPRIQGADICGHIVAVGEGVDERRIGERVLVRTMMEEYADDGAYQCWTVGSEMDGGFAQFAVAPSSETFAVDCDWKDEELASIPCAYSTAEGLVHRSGVAAGDVVLITGASGGVGSAAIQLCKRRGARVIAISSPSKFDDVKAIGADACVARGDDLVTALGKESVTVAIDLVAGPDWPQLLEVLKRGGRYAVSGAIAGPIVELDVRTLYLKDLTFYGCTFQDRVVFENLVSYIEKGEIRPFVSKTYPLSDIQQAQEDFLSKQYAGKLVLIPPAIEG